MASTHGSASPPSATPGVSGPTRLRRRVYALLAVGLGLSVAFVAIEIVLRLVGWPAPGFYVDGRGPILDRWDYPGRHGGMYPPGVARLKHYSYDVEARINEHGFRERRLEPKAPDVWRIGLLGDSYVLGAGVEQAERFGDVWFDLVQDQWPKLEVWNLGSALCGTKGAADILDGVGREYQLDELVLVFCNVNDLFDNKKEYHRSELRQQPIPSLRAAKYWLRTNCRTLTFIWVRGLRWLARRDPANVVTESRLEHYWPDTERALREFKESVGSRPMTIVYLPSKWEWDDGAWDEICQRQGLESDSRYVVRQRLATWAREQGITLIDATAWLRNCRDAAECCLPIDGHWNARGHREVSAGLAADPWTSSRDAPQGRPAGP